FSYHLTLATHTHTLSLHDALPISKDGVVHGCLLQVVGDTSLGEGYVVNTIVLDRFLQGFSEDNFDPLCQACSTCVICHCRSPEVWARGAPVWSAAGVQISRVASLASRSFR